VLLYGLLLMRNRRPRVIGGLNFMAGWALAVIRRAPRADRELREAMQRDQLDRIRRRATRFTQRLAFRA
jgi:hypothetical protein